MSDKHSAHATILSSGHMLHLMQYVSRENSPAAVKRLGEFSSHIEAEHAFFRQFPLGILAEGDRHGVQQMPTRGHAREYAKNFQGWQVKDAGKLASTARWYVVKASVASEAKRSHPNR